MSKATLQDLTGRTKELAEVLHDAFTESEGVVTPELSAKLEEFEALEDAFGDKVDAIAAVIRENEEMGKSRKANAARILGLAKQNESTVARLKDYLLFNMEQLGKTKVETEQGVAMVVNNSVAPVIYEENFDADGLPERFLKVSVSVDAKAVSEALRGGENLPFARLGERGKHVRLR